MIYVRVSRPFWTAESTYDEGDILYIPENEYSKDLMDVTIQKDFWSNKTRTVRQALVTYYFHKGFDTIALYLEEKGVDFKLYKRQDTMSEDVINEAEVRMRCAQKMYEEVIKVGISDLCKQWQLEIITVRSPLPMPLYGYKSILQGQVSQVPGERLRTVCKVKTGMTDLFKVRG